MQLCFLKLNPSPPPPQKCHSKQWVTLLEFLTSFQSTAYQKPPGFSSGSYYQFLSSCLSGFLDSVLFLLLLSLSYWSAYMYMTLFPNQYLVSTFVTRTQKAPWTILHSLWPGLCQLVFSHWYSVVLLNRGVSIMPNRAKVKSVPSPQQNVYQYPAWGNLLCSFPSYISKHF